MQNQDQNQKKEVSGLWVLLIFGLLFAGVILLQLFSQ